MFSEWRINNRYWKKPLALGNQSKKFVNTFARQRTAVVTICNKRKCRMYCSSLCGPGAPNADSLAQD